MNTHTNTGNRRSVPDIPLSVLIKRGRMIFLDASAINAPGFPRLLMQAVPALKQVSDPCVFIPAFVVPAISAGSRANIQTLVRQKKASVLNAPGISDFEAFVKLLAPRSREKGDFCFLSNDRNVCRSIVAAAKASGVFVQIFSVGDDGILKAPGAGKKEGPGNKTSPNAFRICDRPERMTVVPSRPCEPLGPGSTVYTEDGKPVRLISKEFANANGTTYRTGAGEGWAKLFSPRFLNSFQEAKVRRMLSRPVSWPGLCWPQGILKDRAGNFVGILVPPAKGEPLHTAVLKPAGLDRTFPDWTKKDLTDLTITILKAFSYLHSMNILMGCVNPAAIRVVSPREVYFMDTDNYQIEGFPCVITNVSFTPPELQGRHIYLCTMANEDYAVAMLTFMLMMQGKTPYTTSRSASAGQAILEKNFPFTAGSLKGSGVRNASMPGPWRFMWSHLTPFKVPFYQTFQKGARYEKPESRMRAGDWLRITEQFRESLDSPMDPESVRIHPRTFKRGREDTFYRCRICGVEHPRFYFDSAYFEDYQVCNGCMGKKSDKFFVCQCCGKTYYYSNRTKFFHEKKKREDKDWRDQKYCRDCKRKTEPCVECGRETPIFRLRNGCCFECAGQTWKTKRCRSCGKSFVITRGDYHATVGQGKPEPERCPDCRRARRGFR